MNNELNILYQFDDKYAPYAGISIYSLFENNKEIKHLNVYCATMNVSEDNLDKLTKTAEHYNRIITFLPTEHVVKQITDLSVGSWNGSLATWIKMFIIEDLIRQIDNILYIDSDTLVLGSLNELCDFNFNEKSVACVVDSLSFEQSKRLHLDKNQTYYNAGVIYFNLLYFREHTNFYENMIKHLKNNITRYTINDQDLLNDYFQNNIIKLSPEYNFQGTHFMYSDEIYFKVYKKYDYYKPLEITKARNNIRILHFFRQLGNYPWEEGNCHPLTGLYEEWKKKTLWSNLKNLKTHRTLIFKIEHLLFKCLPKTWFLRIFKFITDRMY